MEVLQSYAPVGGLVLQTLEHASPQSVQRFADVIGVESCSTALQHPYRRFRDRRVPDECHQLLMPIGDLRIALVEVVNADLDRFGVARMHIFTEPILYKAKVGGT